MINFEIIFEEVKGLPDPLEPIRFTPPVKGAFLGLSDALKLENIYGDISPKIRAKVAYKIIQELDKGESGVYNKAYFMQADRENTELKMISDFKEQYRISDTLSEDLILEKYSEIVREYLRKVCVRFYLYFKAGYEIKFVKVDL